MLAIAMLCCINGAVAQSKNRLDIILEGPWIIYSGQLQQNSTSSVSIPVVIALAPGVGKVKEDHRHFHVPFLSTGDGYPIKRNGVYCLMFDSKCAPASSSPRLTLGDYPTTVQPLQVKYKSSGSSGSGWDWISAYSYGDYVTVLILPMPDSYSTDGVWNMRFGKNWKDYDPKDNRISIGVQFHYNTGPGNFSLADCSASISIDGCNSSLQSGTQLNNYGTLSITMKSPDNDDPCDPHVRAVYPQMLKLLDDTDLTVESNPNVNKAIAYINPATAINNTGSGEYDDVKNPKYHCYDSDQQDPKNGGWIDTSLKIATRNSALKSQAINDHQLTTTQSIQVQPQTSPTQFDNFTLILKTLQSKNEDQPLSKEDLSTLKQEIAEKLNVPFPRYSQTKLVKKLLLLSANAADQLSKTASTKDSTDLHDFAKQARAIADDIPSKDGKDCRAPIMLVQP
jgi:hypothetical protein